MKRQILGDLGEGERVGAKRIKWVERIATSLSA
jgi:hypothetical protein